MPEATTDNPVADLEINGEGEPKTVSNPDTDSALNDALRAEGFNPDGTPYEAKPADITPKDKKDEPVVPPAATGPTGPTGVSAGISAGATGAPAATGAAAPTDDLDSIELPPHTKPKTAESFANVKNLARQRIAAIEKEREELKTKLADAEKLAKDGLPVEAKKELEELRTFRKQMDVEADPEFKKFDATVSSNIEALYSKLAVSGFEKATIEEIKKMGGPAEVNWDKLLADGKISSGLKRFIDGKLFENDDLVEKKKQAIDTAKKNASEFLQKREAEVAKSADASATEVHETWTKEIIPKMDWLRTEKIDEKMTPEKKEIAEAHNKLVADIESEIKEALSDNSPRMKAMLTAGYAQSRKLRWEFDRLKAGSDAKIAALTKERDEAKSLIERIKKASPGRVTTSAPQVTPAKKITASSHLTVPTDQHLDNLLAEVEAEKAARG